MNSRNVNLDTLNEDIDKDTVKDSYLQLLDYIASFKEHLKNKYPHFDVSELKHQGDKDVTYFTLSTKHLSEKGLNVGVVYKNTKSQFELWLMTQNEAAKLEYKDKLEIENTWIYTVSEDEDNLGALIEHIIIAKPDFNNNAKLSSQIESELIEFIIDMETYLNMYVV